MIIKRIKTSILSVILGLSVIMTSFIPASAATGSYAQAFSQTVKNIKKEYVNLPSYITHKIKSYGVKIYIHRLGADAIIDGGRDLSYNSAESHNFIYKYNEKTGEILEILEPGYIDIYVVDGIEYVPGTLTHEIAHELDYIKGFEDNWAGHVCGYSESNEWLYMYESDAEKMYLIDQMAYENVPVSVEEGFAEAFRLYFTNPQTLKYYCPNSYNYIDELITEQKGLDDEEPVK